MNRILIILVTGTLFINSCKLESHQPQSIIALAERIQPGLSQYFTFELTTDSVERFEIETVRKKTMIRGSTLNSITAGLGWYLKYYCNSGTYWTVVRNKISTPLPTVKPKIVKETSMPYRYYMNHCVDRQAVMHKVIEDYGVYETVNRYYGDGIMPQSQFFYQLHEYERAQSIKS